jgi:hypothetical protein
MDNVFGHDQLLLTCLLSLRCLHFIMTDPLQPPAKFGNLRSVCRLFIVLSFTYELGRRTLSSLDRAVAGNNQADEQPPKRAKTFENALIHPVKCSGCSAAADTTGIILYSSITSAAYVVAM